MERKAEIDKCGVKSSERFFFNHLFLLFLTRHLCSEYFAKSVGKTKKTTEKSRNMQNDQSDNESFLVRYRNETYDLAKFVHKHPGGRNTLSAVLNSDIDHKFENIMPHSDAAKYLINEYKISNRSSSKSNSDPANNNNDIQYDCANDVVDADAVPTENSRTKRTENVAGNNDGEKQLVNHLHNEACLRKGSVNDKCENIIKTDESMEVRRATKILIVYSFSFFSFSLRIFFVCV